jgi:hypothetical protein
LGATGRVAARGTKTRRARPCGRQGQSPLVRNNARDSAHGQGIVSPCERRRACGSGRSAPRARSREAGCPLISGRDRRAPHSVRDVCD